MSTVFKKGKKRKEKKTENLEYDVIGHSISAQFNSVVLSDVLASKHTLTFSFACISALKHYTICILNY